MKQYSYQPIYISGKSGPERDISCPKSQKHKRAKVRQRDSDDCLSTPKSYFEIVLGMKFKTEGNILQKVESIL